MAKKPFINNKLYFSSLLISTAICSSSALAVELASPPHENELEEIIVSGSFEGRTVGETILGTTVLRKEEILRQLSGSIGETLRRQPGITSTFFGPGASRPVIRGLGGDRIRVLDNGIGSIDASATSPDHAVAVEPALAERIEILRGTAMLTYGSSAAGGVVNVIDNRIPSTVPEGGFEGAVRYGYTTVDQGHETSGAFNALIADTGNTQVVLHGDISYRNTDDYDIPGFAESARLRALEEAEEHGEGEEHDEHDEHDEEEAFGTVENSATETTAGSGGIGFIFDNGFFGFNIRKLDSLYGVPGGHHHEEGEEDEGEEHGEEEEESIRIDLDQTRYDFSGEIRGDYGLFSKARFRFGYSDYEHTELEGDEVGTVFSNEGYEARADFTENHGGNWKGTTGFQYRSRDFSAIGAEAFVPPTDSSQFGIYTVKELTVDNWLIEFGGRYEHTSYDVVDQNVERSFDGFSLSAGAGYNINDDTFAGITVFRTERAPSTEELFSNGPHLATNAFEVGDPDLGLETALGIEASYSYSTGPVSFIANAYFTSYDDFIYEVITAGEEDGLPIFEFRANDAQIYGLEAKAEYQIGTYSTDMFDDVEVHVDGQIDVIQADLDRGGNDNLPRLPPLSFLVGVEANASLFDFRTELEFAGSQNDVSEVELPTDSYAFLNVYLTVHPFENPNLSFELRGTNLNNSTGRQHTSFLKDIAPLPGRNIRASFRVQF